MQNHYNIFQNREQNLHLTTWLESLKRKQCIPPPPLPRVISGWPVKWLNIYRYIYAIVNKHECYSSEQKTYWCPTSNYKTEGSGAQVKKTKKITEEARKLMKKIREFKAKKRIWQKSDLNKKLTMQSYIKQ